MATRESQVAELALELGYQLPDELVPGMAEAVVIFDRPLEQLVQNGLALLRSSRWGSDGAAGLIARRIGLWERIQDPETGDVVWYVIDLMGPNSSLRSIQDALDAHAQLRGPGAPWPTDADPPSIARRVLLELGIEPHVRSEGDPDAYDEAMPSGAFGAARLAAEWELDDS